MLTKYGDAYVEGVLLRSGRGGRLGITGNVYPSVPPKSPIWCQHSIALRAAVDLYQFLLSHNRLEAAL